VQLRSERKVQSAEQALGVYRTCRAASPEHRFSAAAQARAPQPLVQPAGAIWGTATHHVENCRALVEAFIIELGEEFPKSRCNESYKRRCRVVLAAISGSGLRTAQSDVQSDACRDADDAFDSLLDGVRVRPIEGRHEGRGAVRRESWRTR